MTTELYAACVPSTFSPALYGLEILSVQTAIVMNYSVEVPGEYRYSQPSVSVKNATFCNVTVTYTHPGEEDSVNVETWLPIDNWNERFQAVGGGGWVAGRWFVSYPAMAGAINDGYATSSTDAGFGINGDPHDWALLSAGNVDLYKLENFGSRSLGEQAVLSKSVIQSFYGKSPLYSYWNGCSQGGRQGLMLAQRYPTAYDGISAGAPALQWPNLAASIFWPQQYMNMLGEYPHGCELDAMTAAAVTKCDGLDGVIDGVVSNVEVCFETFDPFELVGTTIANCSETGAPLEISTAAAKVVNATWTGMVSAKGKKIWHGINIGSDLTGHHPLSYGLKGTPTTQCHNGSCTGMPSDLSAVWLQLLIAKDRNFDFTTLSHKEFDQMVHIGQQQYSSMLATNDPDLSDFRDAGGKMITFHGLADQIIPTGGTEEYYRHVLALIPDAQTFYQYFPVPGLGHCVGGPGGKPYELFSQLREWVENGTEPKSTPVSFTAPNGQLQHRIVCPYPEVARLESCTDASKAECWSCDPSTPTRWLQIPPDFLSPVDQARVAFKNILK